MTSEWFAHSRFVPDEAREQVTAQLDSYRDDVRAVLDELRIPDTTLVISGSLGRQEPSVTHHGGRWRLESDLDLVLLVPDDEAAHPVHEVVPRLARRRPDLLTTGFVVRADRAPRMRSFIAADLALGWPTRIGGPADAPCPVTHRITVEDHLELFAHQLSGWLLYPHTESQFAGSKHYRDAAETHLMKCALEGMRLIVGAVDGQVRRYGDLLDRNAPAVLAPHLTVEEVAELIRRREVDGPDALPQDSVRRCLLGGVTAYLGLPPGDLGEVPQVLADRLAGAAGELLLFRHCLLLLLTAHLHPGQQDGIAKVLHAYLEEWPATDEAERAAVRRLRAELAHGSVGLVDTERRGDWITLRRQYYGRLGDRNFGRNATAQD
ncbi:hypothetical protein [Micromonospora sp. RV43]|uniref:hypothetical protein n=1 Tax=Micromonospora sp. RV43 TaxID=1661387 RepID=UPI00064BFB19|nr:hypothetical protein [Micromonospora sp. RV43]